MVDEFSDFAQELEQFLDFETPQPGDLRTGMIVSISPQGVIVALDNIKRDGIVPLSDLNKLDEEERASLQVNDVVTIRIVSNSDPDSLVVSIFQARILEDWERAEHLRDSAETVEVEVGGYNKGGLIAPFGRLRGFIPMSQVTGFSRNLNERDRQRAMAKMRGEMIPVKVIEVDRQRRRLVFSQREGMKERNADLKRDFFESLKPGDELTGYVRSIRDFGAFVDLGPADGLVHVSELEWYRVKHPKESVKTGQEVQVKVLSVDADRERISLSRRALLENPWDHIHEKYGEGQLVEGVVVRITDYGAFVELEPGVEGLLHITQLSRANVNNVQEIVQEGERHLLRVLTVDSDRQRIRLSLKAVSANEQIEWMTRQGAQEATAGKAAADSAEAVDDDAFVEDEIEFDAEDDSFEAVIDEDDDDFEDDEG